MYLSSLCDPWNPDPENSIPQRSILVARAANDLSEESTEFELTPAIYYGDREVIVGEPFAITCIISITEQIHWLKNGEPITRHNLRHGRDDHAYVLAESAIEGEYYSVWEEVDWCGISDWHCDSAEKVRSTRLRPTWAYGMPSRCTRDDISATIAAGATTCCTLGRQRAAANPPSLATKL